LARSWCTRTDAAAYVSATADISPTATTTDVPGAVMVPTDTSVSSSSASSAVAASAAKLAVNALAARRLRSNGRSMTCGSTRRRTCSYSSSSAR
jgi:hypothetical protein